MVNTAFPCTTDDLPVVNNFDAFVDSSEVLNSVSAPAIIGNSTDPVFFIPIAFEFPMHSMVERNGRTRPSSLKITSF